MKMHSFQIGKMQKDSFSYTKAFFASSIYRMDATRCDVTQRDVTRLSAIQCENTRYGMLERVMGGSLSRQWCTMFDQNQQITYIRVQQCAIDMSPMRDHEMFKQCLNRQTSSSRRLKGTYRVNHAHAPSLLFSARFCPIMSFSKVIFVCFLNVFI